MAIHPPIGVDDFRKLREARLEYVDKSHLIRELIDKRGVEVALIPRPRRFGKTLNLSMLRCFFEKSDEDLSHLFEGLQIWEAGEAYRAHFQRYPVIYLTFKGVRSETYEACAEAIQKKIEALYREHRRLLDNGDLDEGQARDYRAILDGTAGGAVVGRALLDLSGHLHRRHGERVVILIDEYDEAIHAGYARGFAPQILAFFRAFLTEGLKGNPHLHKAVLTGILRVARESIFSGLNNVAVYSLLRADFSTCFGFTEPEVARLLERAGRGEMLEIVRAWYNGYLFGGTVIYNPWSILSFLEDSTGEPKPHWVGTSSNDLVRDLLERHAVRLQPAMDELMEGGGIEQVIEENVALSDLPNSEGALWSLLVFSGYLRAEKRSRGPMEQAAHWLSIPNREVRLVYTATFRRWMEQRVEAGGGSLDRLTGAILSGDAETLEEQLQAFVTDLLSYHDPGRLDPERVYQAFVVGLLAVMEPAYQVRSNRESGKGRPDVLVRPAQPGKPGAALELKVARSARKETLERALREGMEQLRSHDYEAELRASGATPVHAFAVAFNGKTVRVKGVGKADVSLRARKRTRTRTR